ncbi:hypothetical protein [Streptomyces sp. NRRL S-37]|uniref:hypothetical protein n=1 Tax=Streptomyces sp. NRRL S-37 TaxID=1463903 RepID=UPI00131E0C45|nr:hypothetical protein [Streptomyces sp. NRRL S-37]
MAHEDERPCRSHTEQADDGGGRLALPPDVDQPFGRFHGREEPADLLVPQTPVSRGSGEALPVHLDSFPQVGTGLVLITSRLSRHPDPGAHDSHQEQNAQHQTSVEQTATGSPGPNVRSSRHGHSFHRDHSTTLTATQNRNDNELPW